ncbi:hypothetical protein EVAR_101691_1 [Eumeta japonica]|uniref:Uncharacterized protein n=1 Tax=Eumeta variegata TaxID=151549 RepID=A0A4C1SGI0_EUMVA|nr:hypothetical protein EVAR_101691_1 [Eumeta japonica]
MNVLRYLRVWASHALTSPGLLVEDEISDYRKMTAEIDKDKKDYYTYQLKSAKSMQIVLKGIDSCVDPFEPMFRAELEPSNTKFILFMMPNTCYIENYCGGAPQTDRASSMPQLSGIWAHKNVLQVANSLRCVWGLHGTANCNADK